MATVAGVLLLLILAAPAAFAANYVVGDSNGWSQGVDYSTWLQGKTFNVGDTLSFSYGGSHGVDVVSQSDYKNCISSNALSSYNDGSTKITLSKAGSMYFICPNSGHCSTGMKLAVTVGSASSASTTPPSSSTPSTSTTASSASGGTGYINGLVLGSSVFLGSVFVIMG